MAILFLTDCRFFRSQGKAISFSEFTQHPSMLGILLDGWKKKTLKNRERVL